MNNAFLKKMEEKLKKQQKNLRAELSSFAKKSAKKKDNYTTQFPDYGTKEDDNAAEVATFQDNLSLEKDLEKTLQEVDWALDKIKNGTYGKCEKCGKIIAGKRLEAFPAAATCVKCKDIS